MAQDYKVLDFKKGTYQDNYGNYWCDMALEGFGEPVRIAVKDPMEFSTGMTLYGIIETKTSQAGKEYYRFKREKKEEAASSEEPAKSAWQPESPERQDSINRSVSLNNAAVVFQGTGVEAEQVVAYADEFYAWLTRAKGDSMDTIAEVTGEPINLDDIPF